MQLDRTTPTLTPQEFVNRWRGTQLKERSAAQSHFNDLCRMLGWPSPTDVDQAGDWYTFERGVEKTLGKGGWADVWLKGHFGWEYKGPRKDLETALSQLLNYKSSLDHPPLLIVSDMDVIEVHPQFTNRENKPVVFELEDLLDSKKRELLSSIFDNPAAFKSERTAEEVTAEAAGQFATLAERLRDRGEDPGAAAHFLIRLLFCLFAEDVKLLPEGLFTKLVGQAKRQPAMSKQALAGLFTAMKSGGFFGSDLIRHFNGGLFDDDSAIELDRDDLAILERVGHLDWSSIEPAIFGTLFERSLDPSKRSQLGAHYTSKEDILLIVEPVLMAPLRRRWDEVREEVDELAAKRDETQDRGARTRRENEMAEKLRGFSDEIAETTVLDPACGSGNFLYVALRQMLDLQKEVITYTGEVGLPMFYPTVDPAQLRGIEINEYAHELAQVTIWIGYIQWMRENGFGVPGEPVLKPIDSIEKRDAILASSETGVPLEPEWPAATVIVGNPPFLGGNRIRGELGDTYVEGLFTTYRGKVAPFSDLVCYWFAKSLDVLTEAPHCRVGLLATNSIRGGANRKILDRIVEQARICWARSDHPWLLDGASVRVSMIAFADECWSDLELDGRCVSQINADLTSSADLTQARRLSENQGICFQGPSAKSPLDIAEGVAKEWNALPPNVNGRPNSDVVRPLVSAVDITRGSRGLWTIDFGLMSESEAAAYEAPFEYVKAHVYPVRIVNRRASYARRWWQYAEARPGLRKAIDGLERTIVTPAHSKHRVFVWVGREALCNQATLIFSRSDDYFFGVLHAYPHELWALHLGSSLEDRPRYTPTTTVGTFPFPWPPGSEPIDSPLVQGIADAARELVEKRDHWLDPESATEKELKKRTLTNLYNQRPTWLDLAHKKLDEAVLDAYGWPHDMSDEEILERLLALNLERAASEE